MYWFRGDNMNKKIVKEGIKVDFHIHSVGSKYKDHAKVKNLTIENIGILIDKLNENIYNKIRRLLAK